MCVQTMQLRFIDICPTTIAFYASTIAKRFVKPFSKTSKQLPHSVHISGKVC